MSSLEPLQCTLIFFYCYVNHRDLHSFPTRRSSDLIVGSGSDSTLDEVTIDSGTAVTLNTGVPLSDRKSTRLNSSHVSTSYAVFCLKKKSCRTSSGFRVRSRIPVSKLDWSGSSRSAT